jgi:hypothetical protein
MGDENMYFNNFYSSYFYFIPQDNGGQFLLSLQLINYGVCIFSGRRRNEATDLLIGSSYKAQVSTSRNFE